MNLSEWFSYQLKASGEGFVWGVEQVPVERREITPLKPFGEWSVARHIFHMIFYERETALPTMQCWLKGETFTRADDANDQDTVWESLPSTSIESLLEKFQQIRNEQIALLPQFDEALWNEQRESIWGIRTIKWIVSKTFQHTAEHTRDILRMALFWESYEERMRSQEQNEGQVKGES